MRCEQSKYLILTWNVCLPLLTGYLLFKDFCENTSEEPVPHLKFYEEVRNNQTSPFYVLNEIFSLHAEARNSKTNWQYSQTCK